MALPSPEMRALMEELKEAKDGDNLSALTKALRDNPNVKSISFDDKGVATVDDPATGVGFTLKRGEDGKVELQPPLKGSFTLMLPSKDGKGMDAISVRDGEVVDGVFKGGTSKERDLESLKASIEHKSPDKAMAERMSKDPEPKPLALTPPPTPPVGKGGRVQDRGR